MRGSRAGTPIAPDRCAWADPNAFVCRRRLAGIWNELLGSKLLIRHRRSVCDVQVFKDEVKRTANLYSVARAQDDALSVDDLSVDQRAIAATVFKQPAAQIKNQSGMLT